MLLIQHNIFLRLHACALHVSLPAHLHLKRHRSSANCIISQGEERNAFEMHPTPCQSPNGFTTLTMTKDGQGWWHWDLGNRDIPFLLSFLLKIFRCFGTFKSQACIDGKTYMFGFGSCFSSLAVWFGHFKLRYAPRLMWVVVQFSLFCFFFLSFFWDLIVGLSDSPLLLIYRYLRNMYDVLPS